MTLQNFTTGPPQLVAKLNALVAAVRELQSGREIPLTIQKIIPQIPTQSGFWAKITGNDSDPSSDNRWKYAWSEVRKVKKGFPATPGTVDNWDTVAGLRSGTTGTDPAYNTIENMNNATDAHVEGNGVDPANLDPAAIGSDTFFIMPCTTNNIVWMKEVVFVDEDDSIAYIEYWFSYVNGADGGCI